MERFQVFVSMVFEILDLFFMFLCCLEGIKGAQVLSFICFLIGMPGIDAVFARL